MGLSIVIVIDESLLVARRSDFSFEMYDRHTKAVVGLRCHIFSPA